MAGDARPSITIVKSTTYRGSAEEFSNTYHFNGGTPADAAHWKALADAIIAEEKKIYRSDVTIVRAYGHAAGSVIRAWGYDYAGGTGAIAGTAALTAGDVRMPGDAAAWIRWPTTALTSRGKPIYLRNYYHGVSADSNTLAGQDRFAGDQKTLFETYGNHWVSGFSDGTNTYVRSGPGGATGGTAVASYYLTTRTLERRGKRHHTA